MWYSTIKAESIRVAFDTTQKVNALFNFIMLTKPELRVPLSALLHYLKGSGEPRQLPIDLFKPIGKLMLYNALKEYKEQRDKLPQPNEPIINLWSIYPEQDGAYGVTAWGKTGILKNTVGGFTYKVWYDDNYFIHIKMEDTYDWDQMPNVKEISIDLTQLFGHNKLAMSVVEKQIKKFIQGLDEESKKWIELFNFRVDIKDQFWNVFANNNYNPKPYKNWAKGIVGQTSEEEIKFWVESNFSGNEEEFYQGKDVYRWTLKKVFHTLLKAKGPVDVGKHLYYSSVRTLVPIIEAVLKQRKDFPELKAWHVSGPLYYEDTMILQNYVEKGKQLRQPNLTQWAQGMLTINDSYLPKYKNDPAYNDDFDDTFDGWESSQEPPEEI